MSKVVLNIFFNFLLSTSFEFFWVRVFSLFQVSVAYKTKFSQLLIRGIVISTAVMRPSRKYNGSNGYLFLG